MEQKKLYVKYKDFVDGIRLFVPIGAGYLPLGFACGIVCAEAGMSVMQIFLMSLLVYAGAGQYIAGGMIAAGASPLSIIITTFIVNSRHILYTSVLYPYISKWSFLKQSLFAAQITDEVFAMHSSFMSRNNVSTVTAFTLNIFSHSSWVISNTIGGISASLIPDSSKFGLDFTLYALFIALILPRLVNTAQFAALITGGIAATAFALFDMVYIGVVAGAVAGAFAGYYTGRMMNYA
ncbi:AzlC family ABC transporter permease [Mucispirillum schaedleri]|jgi:4-azaleucine resistance transporter AzlC|uniref:Inner membrane protein YgaZ n=1 Tax=Mucispirillum schaedleri ASF457 TaxID=1379858 RepID=V2PWS4_9BACT|nr:AzlC family ABC transporter permease [Mucispirillum schaedleri]MCX4361460.1 AzlC family ABC transporter permease [Mucispirillum schaedleri]USF24844.1 Inner membrane protein YgaZ [Mucispirillum schaedleri ASF457]SIW07666.1 Azaleucine resistance protein AzlC [Mucispirillum schaedleri ASF457]